MTYYDSVQVVCAPGWTLEKMASAIQQEWKDNWQSGAYGVAEKATDWVRFERVKGVSDDKVQNAFNTMDYLLVEKRQYRRTRTAWGMWRYEPK
ncbi:hypothetical protein PWT90_11251 [Aphanocladium album]|nr:hypothetical protein PWT90_11251 [Aphanocladium album]